jgi:nicotinamide riboside kinase
MNNTQLKYPLLFVDTDMYVMKVWCEYAFGKCHSYILDKIAERTCDLYLLCNIDLPWVKDELREYPDLQSRKELFHIYKNILINQSVPWTIITGDYDDRLQKAVETINNTLII